MTQYYTDSSGYSVGNFPNGADWAIRYDEGLQPEIVADANKVGGQYVQTSSDDSFFDPQMLSWDSKDGSDIEIVAKVSEPGGGGPMVGGRASGSAGNRSVYFAHYTGSFTGLAIKKYTGGSDSTLDSSTAPSIDESGEYWVRLRMNGTTLSSRAWNDGVSEPSSWHVTATDSDHASGWVGVLFQDDESHFDVVGVGTSGDSAPTTDPGGDSPPDSPSGPQITYQ